MVKPLKSVECPPDEIIEKKSRAYVAKVTQKINQYLSNTPANDIENTQVQITKTGYDVSKYTDDVIEYEWSSKSKRNEIGALYTRQFAALMNPDPKCMTVFEQMCNRYWKWFGSHWDLLEVEEKNFQTMIMEKTSFPAEKKKKYLKTIEGQRLGLITTYAGNFKTMVKSGETYYSDRLEKDANGCLTGRSDRARLIMVPDPETCGTLTMVQGCFWDKIKTIEHGFIQGMTKEQMLARF